MLNVLHVELHEEESDKEESNEVKQMESDEEEDETCDNEILDDDYKQLTSDLISEEVYSSVQNRNKYEELCKAVADAK